jgi:hypothetical protein
MKLLKVKISDAEVANQAGYRYFDYTGIANKEGEYFDYTGTIDWKGNKGQVRRATFQLTSKGEIYWLYGTWLNGTWKKGYIKGKPSKVSPAQFNG